MDSRNQSKAYAEQKISGVLNTSSYDNSFESKNRDKTIDLKNY